MNMLKLHTRSHLWFLGLISTGACSDTATPAVGVDTAVDSSQSAEDASAFPDSENPDGAHGDPDTNQSDVPNGHADVQPDTPEAADTAIPVKVRLISVDPIGQYCVSLLLRDGSGAEVFSAGADATAAETVEAALAAGAVCGSDDLDTGATCAPGAASATVRLLGMWREDGSRFLPETDYFEPCGGHSCTVEFTCPADDDPPVVLNLTILSPASAGFFDVAFEASPPEGTVDVCYAFRLVNGQGQLVSARSEICVSTWGGDGAWNTSHLMPCDTTEGSEDHVLTWWLTVIGGNVADSWTHPCQALAGATESPATWEGGCDVTARCVIDVSTQVSVGGDD